jgi:methionine-rich copper-binding protein CopC
MRLRKKLATSSLALSMLASGVLLASPAQAATYTANATVTVSGGAIATAKATFKSNEIIKAERVGVAVRDTDGKNFDFPKASNLRIGRAAKTLVFQQPMTPGTYSYFPCALIKGQWQQLGTMKTFTVKDRTSIPQGDIPGWTQVWSEDFTKNAPVGQFRSVYPTFGDYGDGRIQDTSHNGIYNTSQTVSAKDGLADIHFQTINGKPTTAVLVPNNFEPQTYGRYSMRYRADAVSGYKAAIMLWPKSNVWGDGEIDFPEGNFNSVQKGFVHEVGDNPKRNAYSFDVAPNWNQWHIVTVDWYLLRYIAGLFK